jgi:hypothetical protein
MGHDVSDIRGTPDEGMPDELLWNKACQESRLLITTDRGFARYRDRDHHGILIVSLHKPNGRKIAMRVIEAMKSFPPEEWSGLLVVMRDEIMSTWRASKEK